MYTFWGRERKEWKKKKTINDKLSIQHRHAPHQ